MNNLCFNIQNHITSSGLDINKIIDNTELLRYYSIYSGEDKDKLLDLIVKNLVWLYSAGLDILKILLKNDTSYDDEKIKELFHRVKKEVISVEDVPTYDDMKKYEFNRGYKSNHNSPFEELQAAIANEKYAEVGLYKVKNLTLINPNIFANYVNKIIKLVTLPNEMYAIYNVKGVYSSINEFQVAIILRDIMNDASENSWDTSKEREVLRAVLLNTENIKKLNPYKNYLNLENGMLDTETMKLHKHDPKFHSSIRIPVVYNEDAECPRFDKFMEEITTKDKQLISVIQEILGDFLSTKKKTEKAYFFYGSGANGKSVLANIIATLIGRENVCNIPLRQFGDKFGLENIIGKTLNIAYENEFDGKSMNTEVLKAIVSGDSIHINVKYKSGMDYVPEIKLLFLTNSIPDTADNTDGYYRKILIVPFNNKFKGVDADKGLDRDLEAELSGILNFALVGLKRLIQNNYNFSESSVINELMTSYEETQNPVLTFFNEAIMKGNETDSIPKKEVVEAFKNWSEQNGLDEHTKISSLKFWKMFKLVIAKNGINYEETKRQGYHHLKGIKLNGSFKLGESELLLA